MTGLLMPDLSNNNNIINNYFGPFVSSESVDIKEGTSGIVVQNNTINGTGMSDKNFSKSWVSVKGSNCLVKSNIGTFSVRDGFSVICHLYN